MHRHRTRRRPLWLLFAALAAALVLGILGLGLAKGVVRSDSPLPPEKQEIEERYEQMRLDALARPQPPKNPNYRPPPTTPEAWPQGIFETGQSRFPASLYAFENQWQADLGGVHVQVYAGRERDDPSQGLVVVVTTSLDLKTFTSDVYRTPVEDGAVRIVGADGERLTLTSASGATFIFDVASRTFVSPSAPAATPLAPTPTPASTP